jgi:hypothetical protein
MTTTRTRWLGWSSERYWAIWLEQFAERTGLVTAFRFSRPGKLFAEALWSLDRPSRSRQRNMRGCRKALEAALSERGDAHDLVDA